VIVIGTPTGPAAAAASVAAAAAAAAVAASAVAGPLATSGVEAAAIAAAEAASVAATVACAGAASPDTAGQRRMSILFEMPITSLWRERRAIEEGLVGVLFVLVTTGQTPHRRVGFRGPPRHKGSLRIMSSCTFQRMP